MTNRETMLDDDEQTNSPRPRRPGSRLRRALDIARQAGTDLAPTVKTDTRYGDTIAPTADVVTSGRERRARLRPYDSGLTPDPTTGNRKRRVRRGLDALLPPHPDAESGREASESATQGWVRADDGTLVWRPIVTTSNRLDGWQVETYLGVVTGESAAAARPDPQLLAGAKKEAIDMLLSHALARGAHGVIALSFAMIEVSSSMLVSASATAVTLAYRR